MPAFRVGRWFNSEPLAPEGLRGKVVLVDFWEYTCVNCIRTLPFVKAWHARYAASGLVVVGVHAPEFDFGKDSSNVQKGMSELGLTYPIALDNDFETWRAYDNHSWPAKYLFDADGWLRGVWIGEGDYPEVEQVIRQLLVESRPGAALPAPTEETAAWQADFARRRGVTPETYLGLARRKEDTFRVEGRWQDAAEYVEHQGSEPGRIVMDVTAGEINLVMTPGPTGRGEMTVYLDGKQRSVVTFDAPGMIRLVEGAPKTRHALVLETRTPGLRAFAFTFGP